MTQVNNFLLAFQLFFIFFSFWKLFSKKHVIQTEQEMSKLTDTLSQSEQAQPPCQSIGTSIDENLMLDVANGSEHALRMLIEKWKNPLVNFIYTSTRDFQLAEDIAITSFRKLYQARESYQPSAKFSTYLFKIARNELINEFRKTQVRPSEPTDFSQMSIQAPDETTSERTEITEAFENALEKLPEKQRTAISLLVQEELSYAEIAEIMDESIPSVKTLINRARTYLRQAMKDFS